MFTYITQPTWTFNHVDNMGGGTRNNVIYLEPCSCMWVAETFTLHHIVALGSASAFTATNQKRAEKSLARFLLWLEVWLGPICCINCDLSYLQYGVGS